MTKRYQIALNAHLLSGAASYRSAGIHGYLYNTLLHLPEVAPEFDFSVYVGQGQPPQHERLQVRRSRLPTHNPSMRILWEQVTAPLAFGSSRPNLVHGMGFSTPLLWPGTSIVTIFDMSFVRYPERLTTTRKAYLKWITRASTQKALRVIAISQSGQNEIHELLDVSLDRIDVAVPGVGADFKVLSTEQVKAFRTEQTLPERFILFVGTLEPRKNLETLLKAYARLPQRNSVKLVLVGGQGWQSEPLFALIDALNLTNDVLLPGYVPNESLPLWYNAAEVFVYPSIYEGFGLPVLEAMACGTPVIASDTSSLPEAVGEAGILVPPLDDKNWGNSLSELLDNPSQAALLVKRGLTHARQFSWENTARQTANSYRRALGLEL